MARTTVDGDHLVEPKIPMPRRSTRHAKVWKEDADLQGPRLGRRESEPHSSEITYLYDVLTTNFPEDRVMWDLHHYFTIENNEIDIQFDISYFRDFHLPYGLSSYRASKFDNRVPTMAVNILSRSTYDRDVGIHAIQAHALGIPVYVAFNPYLPLPWPLRAPFLRVHYLEDPTKPTYEVRDLKEVCATEEELERHPTEPLDSSKLVDVGADRLPFLLGIIKLRREFEGNLPWYRMILVDRETLTPLPTQAERERQRAEQERQRAEQERQRAEQERQRAEQERQRAEQERQRAERLERELQELKKRLGIK